MRRAGWGCVLAVGVLTMVAALRQPPDVTTDAGTCLLAAEQYRIGCVSAFHSLVEPDPRDLTRDRRVPVTWWPASYEAVPYVFRVLGLTWGRAVTATFLVGGAVGVLGWGLYFGRMLRADVLPWFFAAFLLFRYSHSNANIYDGGEFLFWCVFPAVLLLNLSAAGWPGQRLCVPRRSPVDNTGARPKRPLPRPPQRQEILATSLTVAAGLAVAGLVVVKYSAGLALPGMGAAWWWLAARKRVPVGRAALWSAAAVAGAWLVWSLGLVGGSNPATQRGAWQLAPVAWGAVAWTFAVSDLETLLMRILVHRPDPLLPPFGRYASGQVAWLGPLTVGLLLAVWAAVRRMRGWPSFLRSDPLVPRAREFVIVHRVAFTLALVVLLMAGSAVHLDARLVRPPAIAVLPFLFNLMLGAAASDSRRAKMLGLMALAVFIVIPAAYGASTIVYKTVVRGAYADNRTGPLGLRHDLLAPHGNAVAFYEAIRQTGGPETVYYMIDPGLALPLADARVMIDHAHFRSVAELRERVYRGAPDGGVALVVPAAFIEDGKLETIQESFVDLTDWDAVRLESQPGWIVAWGRP